jgi:hypothetical protein
MGNILTRCEFYIVMEGAVRIAVIITPENSTLMRVVPRSLLWVREYFVGGLDLGELGCSFVLLAVVAVWMELKSFPTVGFLDSEPRLEEL